MRQAAASLPLCPPLLILLAAFVKRRHGTSGQRLLAARAPKKRGRAPRSRGTPFQSPAYARKRKRLDYSLENKLQSQLQCPRVAREHGFRIVEFGITRLQETPASGVADRLNIVQRSRHELRVVQHVECLGREFDLPPFGERKTLQRGEVEVVNVTRWQSIPPKIYKGECPSSDVLRTGTVRQVRDGFPGCVVQGCHVRACPRCALWIEDRSVAGRIAIPIQVAAGLHGHPLRRLVSVDGSSFPVPQHVPLQPAAALEVRHVVDGRECEPVASVQSGVGTIVCQVLEILAAAWRQHGRKEVRRAVVDRVAVSIGLNESQAVGHASGYLLREAMVVRVPIGGELNEVSPEETSIFKSRNETVAIAVGTSRNPCSCIRKCVKSCLAWICCVRWQADGTRGYRRV